MPSVRTVYDERVQPYTPSLYMLSAPILGRYRTYPQYTRTPIPGAGFKPAKLVWGEQVLNLDGANGMRRPYPYGNYAAGVPLLGLGTPVSLPPETLAAAARPFPDVGSSALTSFWGVARKIWQMPAPTSEYTSGTVTLRFSGAAGGSEVRPINYDALVDYAKITAMGTFVGIPVAAALGAWAMHASMRKRVAANRRRARRRAR